MGRHTTDAAHGSRRRPRLRALLAGCLVLGVGAPLTLAAWTDSETATGRFTASTFATESRTVNEGWARNTTAPGATMGFSGAGMSPGSVRYAWLNIRTTPSSTLGGTITLAALDRTGALADALQYRIVRTETPEATCGIDAFAASATFLAGGISDWLATTSPPSPHSSPIDAAGAERRFCVEVVLPTVTPNSLQGTTGTLTWVFTATSNG